MLRLSLGVHPAPFPFLYSFVHVLNSAYVRGLIQLRLCTQQNVLKWVQQSYVVEQTKAHTHKTKTRFLTCVDNVCFCHVFFTLVLLFLFFTFVHAGNIQGR